MTRDELRLRCLEAAARVHAGTASYGATLYAAEAFYAFVTAVRRGYHDKPGDLEEPDRGPSEAGTTQPLRCEGLASDGDVAAYLKQADKDMVEAVRHPRADHDR